MKIVSRIINEDYHCVPPESSLQFIRNENLFIFGPDRLRIAPLINIDDDPLLAIPIWLAFVVLRAQQIFIFHSNFVDPPILHSNFLSGKSGRGITPYTLFHEIRLNLIRSPHRTGIGWAKEYCCWLDGIQRYMGWKLFMRWYEEILADFRCSSSSGALSAPTPSQLLILLYFSCGFHRSLRQPALANM